MPIQFPVAPGTVLICDYSVGFRAPEMVKRRPAVVLSPRLRHREGLCTVVPLSTTPPGREVPYQCRIELAEALPEPFTEQFMWAKADMLATVSFGRLDLFRTKRGPDGRRRYLHPRLSPVAFHALKCAVLHGLGLSALTEHLPAPNV
jgi:uncharacterized protein YifN (PemK superfamily)